MILNSLTDEITEAMLRDVADAYRQQRIREYEQLYDELISDVLDADKVQRYFPRGYNESDDEYNERAKVWVPWANIICSKLRDVTLTDETILEWQPEKDTDQSEADRANEIQQATDKASNWNKKRSDVLFFALGLGQIGCWPETRVYNKETGEKYKSANGDGVVIWEWWFPWFVEPVVYEENVSEIIGAAKIIMMDGNKATPLLSYNINQNRQEITELYMSPSYNKDTGDNISKGFYRKWVNSKQAVFKDSDKWWNENIYGCSPVVFYCAPDPDESKYLGAGFPLRFRNMALKHSQTISNAIQACEALPVIWGFTGDFGKIKNFPIRPNKIVQLPVDGKLAQTERNLDLEEEWTAANNLERFISLVASVPASVWDTLGSAGKVESGVALKILYQPLLDIVGTVQTHYGSAEKERMTKTLKMWNSMNPTKPVDVTKLRPEVKFKRDILPKNETEEIASDILKLANGIVTLTDLVKKYNQHLKTDAEVEAYIKQESERKTAATKAARPTIPLMRNNGQQNAPREAPVT